MEFQAGRKYGYNQVYSPYSGLQKKSKALISSGHATLAATKPKFNLL